MNTADTSSEAGAKMKIESENRIVLRCRQTYNKMMDRDGLNKI
jgi:hypothetical protein